MIKKKSDIYNPTEDIEQQHIFEWARYMETKWPELALLAAVPNGSYKSIGQAMKFKRTGLRKGYPDIQLLVARKGFHGLIIELKRRKGGVVSSEQKWWLESLNKQGFKAVICKGSDEAKDVISKYLSV